MPDERDPLPAPEPTPPPHADAEFELTPEEAADFTTRLKAQNVPAAFTSLSGGTIETTDHLEENERAVESLNRKHFIASESGKVSVLTEEWDTAMNRRVLYRSSPSDFAILYMNRTVFVREGKHVRSVPLGKFWLAHPNRRQYREIVFDPNPARQPDIEVYNLWQGFAIEPKYGDWSLWREHIFEVGCACDQETYDFFIAWCARMVQYPHLPAETAIVWRGAEGAGKGVIARSLGRIVGQHFIHISQARHLTGNFNAHLRDALLVFADEAFWAGDKASEGALKTLITEPTLMIERKGRDTFMAPNRTHLTIATNHEWAVPAGMEARRFCVVDVPDSFVGDRAYFTRLYRHLDSGALNAFLFHLLNYDCEQAPRPPRSFTALHALMTQKLHSMDPVEEWWLERLRNGTLGKAGYWPEQIEKSEVYDDYLRTMERQNVNRRRGETKFAIAMRRFVPNLHDVRVSMNGHGRVRKWVLPSLRNCRDIFAHQMRLPTEMLFPPEETNPDE